MDNKEKKNATVNDTMELKFKKLELAISIIAIFVSIGTAIYTFWYTSKMDEKNYKPIIKIWNQDIKIPIKEFEGNNNLLDDTSISMIYTNIGKGIAQNVTFRIDANEKKRLALSCKNILDKCDENVDCNTSLEYAINRDLYRYDFSFSEDKSEHFSYFYHNDELEQLLYSKGDEDYFFNLTDDYIFSKAYLVSVIDISEDTCVELDEDLSYLITRTLCVQKNNALEECEPITFSILLSYQDVDGNQYDNSLQVSLSMDKYEMEKENFDECRVLVSVSEQ